MNKTSVVAIMVSTIALPPALASAEMMMPMMMGHGHERSPGLAAVLSLTPMPIDFGNFYAENWGWGVGYTVGEVAVFTPMVVLAASSGWGHHNAQDDDEWTREEAVAFYSLLGGFVVLKTVAAIHAARATEAYNAHRAAHPTATLAPLVTKGGTGAVLAMTF